MLGSDPVANAEFPFVDITELKPDHEAIGLAPGEYAVRHQVLPLWYEGDTLVVAMSSIDSLSAVDDLGIMLQRPIRVVMAEPNALKSKIEEHFLEKIISGLPGAEEAALSDVDDTSDLTDLTRMAAETATVQMVNLIFAQAVRDGASDIHIEPYEREVIVRERVDGMLNEMMRPPKRMHAALVSRLKILGEMNIAERRLPQDGRIKVTVAGRAIDIRVSIVPTVFGERAVMRILDKGTAMLGLSELGMQEDCLTKFRRLISLPYGIILATGPTGSGKSTSLYAALQEIWSPTTNILTIEDPVEYQLHGVGQIQVRPNIGLSFASGLRSIVRQDPDVIMVGEIRDMETADIAIHASLTGHLVFSTLHTNDAPGAVTRLLDMGVEAYLVASSLVGVVAQRLVRRVCAHCAEPYTPRPESLIGLGVTSDEAARATFLQGRGCDKCQKTGFRGRQGLYELLLVDEEIRRMTVNRSNSNEMKQHAVAAQGMRTLVGDGKLAALSGRTTAEEVLRVCQREEF
ncbi:MAG: Flp pilus assembly complex ATPase component TadA [Armatimonadetes bacterium]|nr:Flp pilus assembly complex ATPase component TadA [Armatimonadota bacterium]